MRNGLTIWRTPGTSYMDPFREIFDRPLAMFDEENWKPAFRVRDEKGHYLVEAELPGVADKDLDVSIKDGVVTITAERKEEKSGDEKVRSYGKVTRSYVLPDEVDVEKIDAKYKDGILTVSIPKPEEKKAPERKVPVARA